MISLLVHTLFLRSIRFLTKTVHITCCSHNSEENTDSKSNAQNIRGRGPNKHHHQDERIEDENGKDEYPDYRQKMLAKRREAARQAAKERKSALILQQKRIEQAKDEVYDQLVKGGGSTTKSSDKMRKLKKGEHYEDAQREFLENEIRIRYVIRCSYRIERNVIF